MMRLPQQLILRPVVSEKSMHLSAARNTYAFEVDVHANKVQIRQAIEKLYPGRQVETVRIMNRHGKIKRMGKTLGRTPDWKKALVKLKSGQTIELI